MASTLLQHPDVVGKVVGERLAQSWARFLAGGPSSSGGRGWGSFAQRAPGKFMLVRGGGPL